MFQTRVDFAQHHLNELYTIFEKTEGLNANPSFYGRLTSLIYYTQAINDAHRKHDALSPFLTTSKTCFKGADPENPYAENHLYHPKDKTPLTNTPKLTFKPHPTHVNPANKVGLTEKNNQKEHTQSYFPQKGALQDSFIFYQKEAQKKKQQIVLEQSPIYKETKEKSDKVALWLQKGEELINNNFQLPTGGDNEFIKKQLLWCIVSIVHRLCKLAEKKQQSFTEGTFIIEDTKDNALYTMLKKYVEKVYPDDLTYELCPSDFAQLPTEKTKAYPRISSHFNEYYINQGIACNGWTYGITKSDPDYTHYGINMQEGYFLPYSRMQHILFGWVDKAKNLLFIKMEEQGPHTLQHATSTLAALLRKNFGSNDIEGYRKERVPHKLLQQFIKLYPELAQQAKALGISFMYKTVKDDVEQNQLEFETNHPKTALMNEIKKKYDNLHGRIGNEVYLAREELLNPAKTLVEYVQEEIEKTKNNLALDNKVKNLPDHLEDWSLEERLEHLAKKIHANPHNGLDSQEVQSYITKLDELNNDLTYALTLISDDDQETFYTNYCTSFKHFQNIDPTFDINSLFETIGLNKENGYSYTPSDISNACDDLNEGTETKKGQLIRQIKFSLNSTKALATYNAYLAGKESLYMQRITKSDAAAHNITPQRGQRIQKFIQTLKSLTIK